MKLTKARLQKIINNSNKSQTRKRFKRNIVKLVHLNTNKNRKNLNLKNITIKNWNT